MTKTQKRNEAKAILKGSIRDVQRALEMLPKDTNQFAMGELYDAYCKLNSAVAWVDGSGKRGGK